MPEQMTASTVLGRAEKWDHVQARAGYRRSEHRVAPGLYKVNGGGADSPVLVTGNYSLSYDALRSQLGGTDAWIMALDTKGINVWCAAGKGTFGTDEVVKRVQETNLDKVVAHRQLILPQLGAPGVSAHEVKSRCGFNVEYGPIRAEDVPAYLKERKATPDMRRVKFPVKDRAVLIPVELRNFIMFGVLAALALVVFAGWFGLAVFCAGYFGGLALFPLLLPYLPGRSFSGKGLVLGALLSLPLLAWTWTAWSMPTTRMALLDLGVLFGVMAVVAYMALNFTGSTPFASRTGVKKEIFTFIPVMAGLAAISPVLVAISEIGHYLGWF